MTTIDDKVVSMKFDNKQFETASKQSMDTLAALNKSLKMDGAAKGLNEVAAAGKNVQLGHIATAVQGLADKFKALSIIGITALTNIANRAVNAGITMMKSLTIDPIKAGLEEYETNLNSIQTILSNTRWQNTNLEMVNNALAELNTYSDKTIYNFAEMARNIGTFTAAGVKLDTSVAAIKGIANLAAISGSNSQQAATAMYQLSQALAAGKVALMDWNSVVNAGMGGKVFQDALMETARVHGVAIDQIIKDEGSFRDSLQTGWLSAQILTETLSKFTGDLSAEQLKAMGYTEQQIAGILEMGKTAQAAATQVKTFSQLIGTLQEAVGTGWATTWQMIFGDFEEARTMWTNVNNTLGGFISASANARNKVLGDWKELGGRTVIIEAVGNAFNALIGILRPIRDAFRDVFPATTGQQLYNLSVSIRDFTAKLKIGAESTENLRRTFAGVFSVFGIGWDIIKQVGTTLAHLFGVATEGSGSFLEVTAKVGDFLTSLRTAIQEGHALEKFFGTIEKIIGPPLQLIGLFGKAIAKVFDGFNPQKVIGSIAGLLGKLEPLGKLGDVNEKIWSKVIGVLKDVWTTFGPLAQRIGSFFSHLGSTIMDAIKTTDYRAILATLNTGLFAALVFAIRGFIKNLGKDGGSGILDGIKDAVDGMTDTFKSMQNTLKAATLLEIALAIAALTVSAVVLSKIDSVGLTRALTAMSVMFVQLMASMAIFSKFGSAGEFAKLSLVSAAMILLATAIDILAIAVKKLSDLSWDELAKGLAGVTVLLGALVLTVRLMPDSGTTITSSAALILLATAVDILASAVKKISDLDWQELARGLTGVGGLLVALTLFAKFSETDKVGVLKGAGIVLLAAGIKILASAIGDFAKMSWSEIGRGLVAMAGGLALIAAALDLIPPSQTVSAVGILIAASSLGLLADAMKKMGKMKWGEIGRSLTELAGALTLITLALDLISPTAPLSAAGLYVAVLALVKVADVMQDMGKMSWGEIGKSMVVLAGSLTLITTALIFMTEALPGAAALLIVAGALAVLSPILQTFGKMSLAEIGKSLLMLAGVFTVLGVAGMVLAPVVPVLIGLGAAVTLLGAGVALAGVGLLAFSAGLLALSAAGAAGTAALVAMIAALAGLIPMIMEEVGKGVIAFADVIATSGPSITNAIVTVLNSLIDAVTTMTPKIVATFLFLMQIILYELNNYAPQLTSAGMTLITNVLEGISRKIGDVVDAAVDVIVAFLKGVERNMGRVVSAAVDVMVAFLRGVQSNQGRVVNEGAKTIVSFINGVAAAVRNNSGAMRSAGINLGIAIIDGMTGGLASGSWRVASKAASVAASALAAAKRVLGVASPSKEFFKLGDYANQGFANGLDVYSKVSSAAAEVVGENAIYSLKRSLRDMRNVVDTDVDLSPNIVPVLDLTGVKRSAMELGDILGKKTIVVETSYTSANDISSSYPTDSQSPSEEPTSSGDTFTFNQYNSSPKALSAADIYRQTKNQISTARGVLSDK